VIRCLSLLAVMMFMAPAMAAPPAMKRRPPPKVVLNSDKSIFIDIVEVLGPDGSRGTSHDLNTIISQQATRTSTLSHRFHGFAAPSIWSNVIRSYDRHNIEYMPGYRACNYQDALKCGVINGHWSLLTHVTVGGRYTTITMSLYNERAQLVTSSQKTAWGNIRWSPNWKVTKTSDSGNCVDALDPASGVPYQKCSTPKHVSVYEEWPPEMKELPPLIGPYHIQQAVTLLYLGLTRDFMHK
jgi:hypothetical protein